jgi:GTP pyrophosphokinase
MDKFEKIVRHIRKNKDLRDYSHLKKSFDTLVSMSADDETLAYDALAIASIAVKETGLGATSVAGLSLTVALRQGKVDLPAIREQYNENIVLIVKGLNTIYEIKEKNISSNAENYRNLLLNLAGDVRVILIKIAEQLYFMRKMKSLSHEFRLSWQQ